MDLISKESFSKSVKVESFVTSRGDAVHLRVISGRARDEWNSIIRARKGDGENGAIEQFYCTLLVRCLCMQDGVRIYTNDETELLADTADAILLEELFELAFKLNKLGKEGEEEAKKTSPASGDSGSVLPVISESPSSS